MGYLVYVRPDNVMAAVPFDPRSGRVTGAHVEIASDVIGERYRVRPVRRGGERDRGVHPGLRERPGAGEP